MPKLQDKAIKIHGKDYIQVKDRVLYFNEHYPKGFITSKLISDGERVVIRAKVVPNYENPERFFTGISASNPTKSIEKQAPHEVAETSAVGRALGMMGIGVIDSIASADEMNKVPLEHDKQLESICPIHKVKMEKGFSKAKNKAYSYHRSKDGRICFGRGWMKKRSTK